MAKIIGGIGENLSGSLGGLVFVKRIGANHLRSRPRPRDASEWSDEQKQVRAGFRALIRYASSQKAWLIDPIWNKAAKGTSMSGYNLFVKQNRAAFDALGKVSDPALLHFSTGNLLLPYMLSALLNTDNPGSIDISWSNQLSGSKYGDDSLMAVFYNGKAGRMADTGFKRNEGRATIVHPSPHAEGVFLYLFFWNKKLDMYSDDQVFKV